MAHVMQTLTIDEQPILNSSLFGFFDGL